MIKNIFKGLALLLVLIIGIYIYNKFYKPAYSYVDNIHIIDKQKIIDDELNKIVKDSSYTIDNPYVKLNPYGNTPLSAIIIFNTEDNSEIGVLVKGKNEDTDISYSFPANKSHILPIYGLYPDYYNKVILKYKNTKREITIKTDKLPSEIPEATIEIKKENHNPNELIFTTQSPSGKYPVGYDYNGNVRWYLEQNHVVTNLSYLKNGNLMIGSDRLMSPKYNMVGLYEMNLLGKIYFEYVYEGGYHHDFFEMENGDILFLSNDYSKETDHDLIVLMDRKTGKIKRKYELDKLLPMDQGKQQHWTEKSWFHANSIWYDKIDNSITVSGRHQDIIVNIDFTTGELNWLLGDNNNWDEDMQKYFFKPIEDNFEWQYAQHSVSKKGNTIYIFDNGNNRSKIKSEYISPRENYSRGLVYEIDTEKMTVKQVYEHGKQYDSAYFSPYISSFDVIEDNHYLINFGGVYTLLGNKWNAPAFMLNAKKLTSYIIEHKDNIEIFKMDLNTNLSRAKIMTLNPETLNLNYGEIKGVFRKKVDNDKIDFSEVIEKSTTKYDFNIIVERDRIQFSTRLFSDNEIKLILKNYKETLVYSQFSSNRFNRYNFTNISTENLKGSYDIYVFIDNKLYKLEDKVIIK